MNCSQALDVIDAAPFVDVPPARLESAWHHARECPTCGAARSAADEITTGLLVLPQPASPPDLSTVVMARIARLEPPVARLQTAPRRLESWPAWVTIAGIVAIVAATMPGYGPAGVAALITPFPSWPGALALPSGAAGLLALVAGLALYVSGLFAPVWRRR